MLRAIAAVIAALVIAGSCRAAEAPAAPVTAPNQPTAVETTAPAVLPAATPSVESTRPAVPAMESTSAQVRAARATTPVRDDPNNWVIGRGIASTDSKASEPGSGYTDSLKITMSLAAVIAVIVLAVWGFKRLAPRTASMFASENLKVISRTYLGPKQAVYLVKAPGRLLVVASAQDSITLLSEITDPVEIERVIGAAQAGLARSQTKSFTNVLSGLATGAKDRDADAEAELAAAVKSVSERFAKLNRRLETFEGKAD